MDESGEVGRYCGRCGRAVDAGDHEVCVARAAYDPPRFCPRCARRMVVQVTPAGWVARCSAHGEPSRTESAQVAG